MTELLKTLKQAHKRDPSYFPALIAAIILCGVLYIYKSFV